MNDRRRGGSDSGFDDGSGGPGNKPGSKPATPSRPGTPSVPAKSPPRAPTGQQVPRTATGSQKLSVNDSGARTIPSHMEMGPRGTAPQRTSTGSNPKVPVTKPPVGRTATGGIPQQGPARTPTGAGTPARTSSSLSNPRVPVVSEELGASERPSRVRAKLTMSSDFADDDDERTQLDTLMGGRRKEPEVDDDEATAVGEDYDGVTPAKEVVSRDLWKAIHAPVQSKPGRRSPQTYGLVIDQFAVGHNPRYEPDAPDKPRAHIFVWDVTRAMNCEVPHFVGPKELTLSQTVDWLRHEGPMRGWRRADAIDALTAAQEGLAVIAIPKDVKVKLLGICRPGEPHTDGKPLLAAAAKGRGNSLTNMEALGTNLVEYFVHS
ncbi:MAG: hypothetical protein ACJ790_15700 [Myxococcaceae bacterium]